MLDIQGKYNTAKVFTDNIDNAAYSQILNMMCQIWAKDSSGTVVLVNFTAMKMIILNILMNMKNFRQRNTILLV